MCVLNNGAQNAVHQVSKEHEWIAIILDMDLISFDFITNLSYSR